MVIFVDLGIVLIIAIILIFIVVGSVSALVDFILAHLIGFAVVFMIIGLLIGILVSYLMGNKLSWLVCSITTPAVYIFPFLIAIPHLADKFNDNFWDTLFFWPFWVAGMIILFALLWMVHGLATMGFNWERDERSPIITLLSGIIGTGIQVGALYLMYQHWIA